MQGIQRPRICSIPEGASPSGVEALELARYAGLTLDPWQEFVLVEALREGPGGRWSAFEVGACVPRQNGKNEIVTARQLAGLFLFGERLQISSAHQFDTSLEAFRRLLQVFEATQDLTRRVKRVVRSHGEEGIELKGGQRVRFRTRTKGGGRGFTADSVTFDEAMVLSEASHGAILPTLAARPDPQVWYFGSPVDEEIHEHGLVFARIRERAMKGDPRLAYFEWSVEADGPGSISPEQAIDMAAWATANPGLGIRISTEHVSNEQRSMDPRTFAVERLGVGAWPRTDGRVKQVIDPETWAACADPDSRPGGPITFAFDVSPDRRSAAIAAAGIRPDGLVHAEIVEHRPGTGWLPDRLRELSDRHSPAGIVCDERGPAAALLGRVEALGLEVMTVAGKEYAQACGYFFDACDQRAFRHLDTAELNAAVKGAAQRPLSDAWAWSRKSSSVDITPLVSVTFALWGASTVAKRSAYQDRDLLVLS